MSTVISIRFLAGRFHATPWENQVNEGVVEWPPSPWRILRSLVSAYYRSPSPPSRTEVCQLLTLLASHLPSYALPDCTTAHTRHYMPVWKEGKETTTKVFDTFLVLAGGTLSPDAEVQVVWPDMQLSQTQTQVLSQLCRQVTYLGRAESWAELSVIETNRIPCNATPLLSEATPEAKQIKVLAPLTPEGLEGFQVAIATLPKPNRGKAKWKAPTDVLEALELDIASLHGQGWNGIPGTRWVSYELKAAERFSQQQGVSIYGDSKPPTFAKFALVSNVLPNLTEAVSVGERFRQALMKWSQDETGKADPVFSGRKDDGQPALDHQHAWYLPEVNKDGKIDHVVVYARSGFKSEPAIKALQRLSKVWGSEGFDLQTVLVSLGKAEDYGADGRYQQGRSLVVGRGRVWRSLTPMVLPRHPKRNRRGEPKIDPKTDFQIDGPEQQALRLLKQQLALQNIKIPVNSGVEVRYCDRNGRDWLGWVGPDGKMHIKVRCLSDREAGKFISIPDRDSYRTAPTPIDNIPHSRERGVFDPNENRYNRWSSQAFQRRRYQGGGYKGSDKGYWLEIQFEEPQQGPIALGYAAHFGLGVFIPIG